LNDPVDLPWFFAFAEKNIDLISGADTSLGKALLCRTRNQRGDAVQKLTETLMVPRRAA
jgi:hypothetical protein